MQAWRKIGRERRTNCRYRLNAPTLVSSETGDFAAALLLEASESGLCLSLPFGLPLNSQINIQLDDVTISGFIRNCVCIRAMEFHVGIHVPPGLNQLPRLRKAQALNLYASARASRVWSSPA